MYLGNSKAMGEAKIVMAFCFRFCYVDLLTTKTKHI